MASPRIIVLSPDKERVFGKKLIAGAVAAGAEVTIAATLGELEKDARAELVVAHAIATADVAKRFPDAPIVAVIPSSSLDGVVKAMKAGKVVCVLVADTFEAAQLAKVASRVLTGDVFGVEKMVPWGVRIHGLAVGDYAGKSEAIERVSDFAAAMGVRRKYRDAIEQCLDELLMNALYDAPVDARGQSTMANVSTKERISMQMEQKALVRYACDGEKFIVSVRDGFGTLKPDTVVKYIEKCLRQKDQIDRKQGGAGLGLYLVSSASTELIISIHPGAATEAICTFDLEAAKVQLKEFALFTGRARTVEGLPAIPPPPSGMTQGGLKLLLSAAIALLLALIAVVALKY